MLVGVMTPGRAGLRLRFARADLARYLELMLNETEWRRVWKRNGGARPDADVSFNSRTVSVV